MSEVKFTKGEWFVVEANNEITVTCDDCDIFTCWTDADDAKLISKAPKMYNMLKTASEILKQVNGCAEHHTAKEIDDLIESIKG